MTRIEAFQEALKHRIVVLDGAMGTMIQQHPLTEVDLEDTGLVIIQWICKGLTIFSV